MLKLRITLGVAVAAIAATGILGVMQPDGKTTVVPAAGDDSTVQSVRPKSPAADIGDTPHMRPASGPGIDSELVEQARRTAARLGIEEAD